MVYFVTFSLGMLRVTGCLEKSTAVMSAMSALVKLPEIRETMMEMSKEMTKVRDCLPHVDCNEIQGQLSLRIPWACELPRAGTHPF